MDGSSCECQICNLAYDSRDRKPMVGTCGHTLCDECRSKINLKCPFCNRERAFASRIVNYAIFDARQNENGRIVARLTVLLDGPSLSLLVRTLSPSENAEHENGWAELRSRMENEEELLAYARQVVANRRNEIHRAIPGNQLPEEEPDESRLVGARAAFSLAVALSELPPSGARTLLQALAPVSAGGSRFFNSLLASSSVRLASVTLSAVYLIGHTCYAIVQWYRGIITGEEVCLTFFTDLTTMAGASAGAALGATAGGAVAGPFGIVVGGVAGGVVAGILVGQLARWLLSTFFDLRTDVALVNAYSHLGIPSSASNGRVNEVYRRMCFMDDPRLPHGSEDAFQKTQAAMAIIAAARNGVVESAEAA